MYGDVVKLHDEANNGNRKQDIHQSLALRVAVGAFLSWYYYQERKAIEKAEDAKAGIR
jgi:hypothetical protein